MPDSVLFDYRDDSFYIHHTRTERPQAEAFSFRSHSHNMYEVYFFVGGEAGFVVEGRVFPLQPGSVVMTDLGQTHHTQIRSGATYERIALLFSPKMLPEGMEGLPELLRGGSNLVQLDENERVWMLENIRCIRDAQEMGCAQQALRAALAQVLLKVYSRLQAVPPAETQGDALVQDILRYVNRNLSGEWTLDDLARALYRSKPYLNRRFRSVMGCSIWEYVLRKRVFAAQQQLYFYRSVQTAFRNSGFQDYSVFYRQYKRIIGLSPSEDLKQWTRSR